MPTIGEQLRIAREAKGLTIEDAHRHTKIHAKLLQAMEEDRTREVLEPAYARGFIKKYAGFLNLDPKPLLDEYRRVEPAAPPRPVQGHVVEDKTMPRWIGPLAIVVVATIGVAFLTVLAKDLSRTVTTSTAAPASKPIAQPPKPIVPKSQPLRLSVKASQDCWMQIKADDKVLFQNVLHKGQEELWTASEVIELWVGNAAALTLSLNGRILGPLGSGVIKGIRVTRFGLRLPKPARPTP